MSTPNITDPGSGQAVASLDKRGGDDFASLIGGDTGGGSQEPSTQETTKVAGSNEKPELVETVLKKPAGTEGTQQTTQQTTQQAATTTPAAAATPGTIDKGILDQIVETATRAAAGASAQGQQTSQAQIKKDQKELTPEEFNAKYQIPEINEATIQSILDADPKKGAAMLRTLLIRITGSAVLMSNDVIDRRLQQVRDEMNPHVSSWQTFQKEQREQKLVTDFYAANKDLENEKPLVKEMQDAIFGRIASGQMKPFARPEDALKAVADATRAVLARMGRATGVSPTQGQAQTTGQGQQTAPVGRQMAAASTTGRSGGGSASPRTDVEEVFGNDAV
jgi:hypothetical protein